MHIRDLTGGAVGEETVYAATIGWEDHDFPDRQLIFAFRAGGAVAPEPPADAFLAACFPLAAVFGERRVRIDGAPCPMLIDGLMTAHAVWAAWGGLPGAAPAIETWPRRHGIVDGERRGVVFLSGGVDGLHALWRNRRLYRRGDPAYIRDALLIHGFDIGKRAREPENEHFRLALRALEPVAAETGVQLIACRTNLRHLPEVPGFWTARHNGAALAAVGHAATSGPTMLFIGGTYPVATPVPMGSHPALDPLYSSQRVAVIHDGARFSRLDKVRDLARWPTAVAALRVCPANPAGRANCGRCEKCLTTRLELLVAGVEKTEALGPSLTPLELWRAVPPSASHRALRFQDLLPPLRARGLTALCDLLEERLAHYRARTAAETVWPGARFANDLADVLVEPAISIQDLG